MREHELLTAMLQQRMLATRAVHVRELRATARDFSPYGVAAPAQRGQKGTEGDRYET